MSAKHCWTVGTLTFAGVVFFATVAAAVDPPRPTVREALRNGRAAFLARALKLEEQEQTADRAVVSMDIRIVECYYGPVCQTARDRLEIRYVTQTFIATELPVDFEIGCELLFVLQGDPVPGQPYVFDSDVRGAMDFGFVGNKLLKAPIDAESAYFSSVYTGKGERVTYLQLREWAASRPGK
jgi:hypothetical protein